MKPIRILIFNANRSQADELNSLFVKTKGFTVKTLNGISNLSKKYKEFGPHVILLNPGIPEFSPRESIVLALTLNKIFSDSHILLTDISADNTEIYKYIKAGVSGFILKDTDLNEIVHAVRKVANGEKLLPEPLTNSLFSQIARDGADDISLSSKTSQTKKQDTPD